MPPVLPLYNRKTCYNTDVTINERMLNNAIFFKGAWGLYYQVWKHSDLHHYETWVEEQIDYHVMFNRLECILGFG